jgi:hypothetical protein
MGARKRTCCRSVPRCAGCPVLLLAGTGTRHGAAPTPAAALVGDVLRGSMRRELPAEVERALSDLEAARAGGRFGRRSSATRTG